MICHWKDKKARILLVIFLHNLYHRIIQNSSEIMVYFKRLKLALGTKNTKMYQRILNVKSFYYPMRVSSFQISVAQFSMMQLEVFSQAKRTESIVETMSLREMGPQLKLPINNVTHIFHKFLPFKVSEHM